MLCQCFNKLIFFCYFNSVLKARKKEFVLCGGDENETEKGLIWGWGRIAVGAPMGIS